MGSLLGMANTIVNALTRPRVLLLGDPMSRPDGLERALVRGGFQVTEADLVPGVKPVRIFEWLLTGVLFVSNKP